MTDAATKSARRENLSIRIRPEDRGLIDHAAALVGKNRTEFMLDAARQAAEEAVLDRRILSASAEAYAAFLRQLDEPPRLSDRLRKTLSTPAPWE